MSRSHLLQQFLFPSLILKEPILFFCCRDPFFSGQEFRLITTRAAGMPLHSVTMQHLSGQRKLLVRHLRCLCSRFRSGLERIVNGLKCTIKKSSEHGIWRISFENIYILRILSTTGSKFLSWSWTKDWQMATISMACFRYALPVFFITLINESLLNMGG